MVNIQRKILRGKKIAVCFGSYAPAHQGEYRAIIQAKRQTDGCLVIVSGHDLDNKTINGMSFNNRFRSMRELFSEDEVISIVSLDESAIFKEGQPENACSPAWCDRCKKVLSDSITDVDTVSIVWYIEKQYEEQISSCFPGDEIVIVDTAIANLTTTDIRNNPYKYWRYIMEPFRKYFSNNFLFFGTASTGKTNLVRDIARAFNAPYTDEYARRYESEYNVCDDELRVADLHNMGVGQFNNNRDAITSAANNGLMFADTDTMITKCYAKEYLSPEDFSEVEKIFDYYIEKERWALIFVIPPITEYVNDAFRDMTHADSATRWAMHEMFMEELKLHGLMDKVRYLEAKDFYETYTETFNTIQSYIHETYDVKEV